MSHSVTITRTTTTTSGSTLFVNSGYLKTLPGLLKLAELAMGAVCVGLAANYFYDTGYRTTIAKALLFFFIVSVSFLIGTFCLLLSCLISLSTSTIISKTIYEVIFHGLAFILYLAAALTVIIEINHGNQKGYTYYEPLLAASIIGLVLACLYLVSTFLASRTYRGI